MLVDGNRPPDSNYSTPNEQLAVERMSQPLAINERRASDIHNSHFRV